MEREPSFEEEARILPYGIAPRTVYYVCMHCGYMSSKDELDQMPSLMCPRCGYRIFTKTRSPPSLGFIRRVKAE